MSLTLYGGTGPTITVSLGLNSLPDSQYAVWDSDVWNGAGAKWGPDLQLTDITQWVQAISIFNGRQRESDRYLGNATVTLKNNDARFTPGNTTGPYSVGGVTQLKPLTYLEIVVNHSTLNEPTKIFVGYISNWQDDFPAAGKNAVTVATAVDPFVKLSRFDGLEQGAAGAGERTDSRLRRIFENAGMPSEIIPNFAIGAVTVQATTLAQNALTETYLTVDSEGGALYSAGGEIIFQPQTWQLEYATTSLFTFAPTGVGAIPFSDPVLAYDDASLRNIITYARAGGTQQTATDLTSRAQYGYLSYGRSDLICETDDQVATLAARDLQRWKDPEYRVASITVSPRKAPTVAWEPVLVGTSLLRYRVTVTVPVPVSAFEMTKDCFIEGVQHDFTPSDWTTVFYFGSTAWTDDYAASLWDTGIWDTSVWN